jgi:hypothetical protein
MFADASALPGDARSAAQDMIVEHGFWAMGKKRFSPLLIPKLLELNALRNHRLCAKAFLLVLFVILKVAFD